MPVINTRRHPSDGYDMDGHQPVATVFVPATVGNVGPGFDVLGLAVEGLGDTIQVALTTGMLAEIAVTGRDADAVPREPTKNCAFIAATALLGAYGASRSPNVSIERGLPVAGGLGSSAAASVGGAVAAAIAINQETSAEDLLLAALCGEQMVAGRHLDNIAPCLYGGLTVVRSIDPPEVVPVAIAAPWWVALVSPDLKIATRDARTVLPASLPQSEWVAQVAQTAALVTAFTSGDAQLATRALHDPYAEPRRKHLIPGFDRVQAAARQAGALGCSISGAGPTLFAVCPDESVARRCAQAMVAAFQPIAATAHAGPIAQEGARVVAS